MALPDSNYAHSRESSSVFQCQFKVDSSFGPASCTTNESLARVQLEAATVPKLKVVEKPGTDERFEGKGAVTFVTSRPGLSVNSVITGSSVGDERSVKNGNSSVASSSASNTLTDAQPTMEIKKEQLPLSGGTTSPSATLPHARCDTLYPVGPASSRGWGIPPYERLRGGGENGTATGGWGPTPVGSSSAAATGWGNPSQTQGQNQWGATAAGTGSRNAPPSQGQQQAPASAQQSSAWNQSAKNVQENSSPSATAASAAGNGSSATSTGQQKDPNAREVIYSVDGWCSNNVNQDTTWDVPHSPGLAQDKDIPGWKQTANNGTEVWEATLRNGGQVPAPQTQPKAPWGYTPSTNIGGTWEEEDDAADSSSAWGATSPQWGSGGPASGPVGPNPTPGPGPVGNAMWGGPKKEPEWPNPAAPIGAGAANTAWGGVSRMGGMGQESEAAAMGPGNWSKGSTQWGAPGMGPKEMAGWGDQSPPSQKRVPGKEEGTALWGNAQPQQHPNKSHWQEMPVTNIVGRGMQPPGPPPGRGPHGSGMKDLPMWGAPPRNGSWGDVPGGDGGGPGIWMEGKGGGSHWNEPQTPTWGGHGQKARTPTTPSGWGEPEMLDSTPSWGQPPKPSGKNLSKDFVWASKQFRILSEMGFKKDDVENALRVSGMNVEDALEMLYTGKMAMGAVGGGWRPPTEDHSSLFDQSGPPVGPYGAAGQRYGGMGQQQPMGYGHQGAAHLLGNPAGPSMGLLQKGLPQQHPPPPPPQGGGPGPMFGIRGGGRGDMGLGGQPSPAQLHGLVQQIQTAVRAGHLNPQILNQPLAPQTLILLNQLLQQLKILQQLGNQQATLGVRPSMAAGGPAVQLMQQMTKTKQQIVALQNQISAQQALYMKQQGQYVGQQPPGGPPPSQPGDMYKSGGGGGLDLSSKFEQISIQDGQSRLNQWKRTSPMDKNELDMDFSRAPGASGVHGAPGSVSKPPLAGSLSSPNLNPLLGHGEGAWSSLSRSQSDSGWPESATADLNSPGPGEGKDTWAAGGAVSDLVPEFKPGEPWKGPLLKTIEDDPTLTPAQFMGGGDGFGGKSSSSTPPAVGSSSSDALSSTTWSFNSSSGAGSQSGNKFGQAGDLWAAAKPRGPPPGISAGGKYGAAGGWSGSLNGNSPFLVLRNLTPQIDGSTLKTLCLQHGPVQNFHLYLNQGVALVRYSSSDEAAKAQGALNNCGLGNTTILADLANENDVQGWLQQLGMPGQQQQQPNQQQQSAPGSGWGARGSTPSSGNGNSGSSKPGSSSVPEGWNPAGGGSSSQMWSSASGSVWSSNPADRGNSAASSLNASLNSFLPGDLLGNEPM